MIPLDRLIKIIPQDQAVANKALAVSLQGITGIGLLTLADLAAAAANVQTTAGLPLITNATSAVSSAATASIQQSVATGTGQYGTLTMDDILGTAAGHVSANVLKQAAGTFGTMDLSPLISVYTMMNSTVSGAYGDPVAGPVIIPGGIAAGTYTNATTAFNGEAPQPGPPPPAIQITGGLGLLLDATEAIDSVTQDNPDGVASLNTGWQDIMNQLTLETRNQSMADLNFGELGNQVTNIYSLDISLPQYGQDTVKGGVAEFLQDVVDLPQLTAQAVVAVMRQGQTNLTATMIASNDAVPVGANPPTPPAALLPAQPPYSAP